MAGDFIVNASWQRKPGRGLAVTRTGSGRDVAAYVTEFNTNSPTTELRANIEMRELANGSVFLGVLVRSGPDTILSWGNHGDPSGWVLPGMDVDRGGKWPDVTPRQGIDPASVEGKRRSAAWVAGDDHRRARRMAGEWGRWDASDWATAAAEYWRLRSAALDAEGGDR